MRPPDQPPVQAAELQYVGDEACASCHADLYTSYKRTGMGRSMSRFDPATAPERFPSGTRIRDPHTGFLYEPFVRGDTLYQRELRLDEAGRVVYEQTYAAEWVVGSGNATRSYLMNVNGHVTEMPLTWYVERGIWDLSPGYAQNNLRFSRPINEQCMTCHNAIPAFSPFTQSHYEHVPLGISCERCHGPASAHVETRLAGFEQAEGQADPYVVNPAHLDRGRQLAVCQQCHLSGTTVFLPGEGPGTFRPGQRLGENRAVFVSEEQMDDPERFGISSHAKRLALSACYKESAMTCTTCHDPHRPTAEMGADHFNRTCQGCHTPSSAHPEALVCDRTHGAAALTGNCVSCHLQQGGTSDIPHVTFTDHWIRRTLPPAKKPEDIERAITRREPFKLVRVVEEGETATSDPGRAALEEALAYFEFYETTHRIPEYLPLVKAGVRRGLSDGADGAEAHVALGRVLMLQDSLAAAERALATAAAKYAAHARVHYWLGEARRRLGRAGEAVPSFERAVAIQPEFIEARHGLAQALDESGRIPEAEAAYREVLRRDPVHHPAAWNNLGFLLLRLQRLDDADVALERALALDPDLAVALVNRGSLRLMQSRPDDAATLFQRALQIEPDNVSALANLGVIAAQAGRYREARDRFRRVVQLSPGDERARAMLAQVEALVQ